MEECNEGATTCADGGDDNGIDAAAEPKTVLSKKQLKKEAKRKAWLERRVELRKVERQKLREKRRAKIQAGTYQPKKVHLMADSRNKFRIVIDMNFEDYMTEKELGMAVRQVATVYSINRISEHPCQLYVSSLKGKIKARFDTASSGYKSWDINTSDLDYQSLFKEHKKEDFIYLSGDAEDTLPDVESLLKDDKKIFIIGGLVDHNRHKNLCHKMALEQGIPTAKLPLKENIELCQRHILSTVNVFDILLHVLGSHKSWKEAFEATIPKRKIAQNNAKETVDDDDDKTKRDQHDDCDKDIKS